MQAIPQAPKGTLPCGHPVYCYDIARGCRARPTSKELKGDQLRWDKQHGEILCNAKHNYVHEFGEPDKPIRFLA